MNLFKYSNQLATNFDRFIENEMNEVRNRNSTTSSTSTFPTVNIKSNPDGYIVEMVAPGFEKEDFKIDFDNNLLTISSEKKEGSELKEDEKFTRKEFSYDSFTRSFTLPNSVDGEQINASYTNGILGVVIPKKEEAKPKPPRTVEVM